MDEVTALLASIVGANIALLVLIVHANRDVFTPPWRRESEG